MDKDTANRVASDDPLSPLDVPLDSQHSSLWQAEDVHNHPLSKGMTNCRGLGGPDDMFPLRRALREMLPIRLLAWIRQL